MPDSTDQLLKILHALTGTRNDDDTPYTGSLHANYNDGHYTELPNAGLIGTADNGVGPVYRVQVGLGLILERGIDATVAEGNPNGIGVLHTVPIVGPAVMGVASGDTKPPYRVIVDAPLTLTGNSTIAHLSAAGLATDIAALNASLSATLDSHAATLASHTGSIGVIVDTSIPSLQNQIDSMDTSLTAQLTALTLRVSSLEDRVTSLEGRMP